MKRCKPVYAQRYKAKVKWQKVMWHGRSVVFVCKPHPMQAEVPLKPWSGPIGHKFLGDSGIVEGQIGIVGGFIWGRWGAASAWVFEGNVGIHRGFPWDRWETSLGSFRGFSGIVAGFVRARPGIQGILKVKNEH